MFGIESGKGCFHVRLPRGIQKFSKFADRGGTEVDVLYGSPRSEKNAAHAASSFIYQGGPEDHSELCCLYLSFVSLLLGGELSAVSDIERAERFRERMFLRHSVSLPMPYDDSKCIARNLLTLSPSETSPMTDVKLPKATMP